MANTGSRPPGGTPAAGDCTAPSGQPLVHRFCGSPFEVGYQQGRFFARAISDDLTSKVAAAGGRENLAARANRLWRLHKPHYDSLLPASLEEIRGLADGAEISFDLAFYISHETGSHPFPSAEACSSIVIPSGSSTSGTTLVGQNKDTHRNPAEHCLVHKKYSDGRQELLVTYAGWIGNIGISSTGVGLCGNSLTAPEPTGDVLTAPLLWRILQETGDVDAVICLLGKYPFSNGSVLAARRGDGAWCFEMAAGRHAILRSKSMPFARANTILDPLLAEHENRPLSSPSSDARQLRMDQLLRTKTRFNPDDLAAIFADHDNYPLSVCRHHHPSETIVTTACYIADVDAGTLRFCRGNPCTAPWVTVGFD